jgi:hypothetical protein
VPDISPEIALMKIDDNDKIPINKNYFLLTGMLDHKHNENVSMYDSARIYCEF